MLYASDVRRFSQIFGVALMGTLLLPVTCNSGRFDTLPDGVALLVFPAPCSQLRPHMVPGVLAFLIQACMYVITAIKDCEMDPFSSRPLAPASPGVLSCVERFSFWLHMSDTARGQQLPQRPRP